MGFKLLVIFTCCVIVNGQFGQEGRIVNEGPRNRNPILIPSNDLSDLQLFEDVRVGTHVYTLRGQDPEGAAVSYTISGDYFSADRQSGKVTLVKQLDRELVSNIDVVVTVQDDTPTGITAVSRRIRVLDRNDNSPKFEGNVPYSFSVKETQPVGQTVFSDIIVSDADEGINSEIQLTCLQEKSSPDACDTFNVFAAPTGPGRYSGVIALKKPLNYEDKSSYNLVIEAKDGGEDFLTATTDIIIQIEDIQDQDPVFLNGPYSATVPEGTAPGSNIFEIIVRDGDTGIPRPVQLSLEGDKLDYFRLVTENISPDGTLTATLTTSDNVIDRENPDVLKEGGLYPFQIVAKEIISNGEVTQYGEETRTSVTIVVTDVDDELPVFNRDSITVPVPEDVGSDTPLPGLTLEVIDKDVSKNSEFRLMLEPVSDNSQDVFYIYPEAAIGKTPVIIRVKNPDRLDYENKDARNFQFNVVAITPNGQTIKSAIEVVVTDSNDNIPIFEEKSYEFSIAEDSPAGTVIGVIQATDPDSGSYGEIVYSIKGFGSEKFSVVPETGEIIVAACGAENEIIPYGESCLDYEDRKTFSLTYTATDGGGQTVTTNLVIMLEDANDNHPKFDRDEYKRVVKPSDTSFDPPLVIKAIDDDGPLQGDGKVFYSIESINTDAPVFQIDPVSGELTMTRPVRIEDTENGRYDLVVRARDQGTPPLYSDVKVFVDVGSTRNQKPKFEQDNYDVTIKENAPQGSDVVKVSAYDPDGDNNSLRYFIHSGSKDNFVVNSNTGMISIAEDADISIEQNGEMYEMEVIVVDNGEPYQQTSSVKVSIIVEDVNNIPPKFTQESYTEYVVENEPKGHVVLTVMAQDPDRSANLEYDIVEPIYARDKSGTRLENIAAYNYKEAFVIDPRNGKISINEKLSYASAAIIILTVQVTDKNAEDNIDAQIDTADVTLYIKAFNADNPIFPAPWTPSDPRIIVNISENIPPGKPLFKLAAKDPVTGQDIINYQKLDQDSLFDNVIQISPLGHVISNQMLDFEQVRSVEFSVAAIAGDLGGERVSEAHVVLQLVDVNDNAPVFDQQAYQVDLPEDALPLTNVLTVSATDADTGDFGKIVYGIQGEGSNEFMIDEQTGTIQVRPGASGRSSLDREWIETYNLRITAKDMPGGGSDQKTSTVMVKVNLQDVNDSPPEFSQSRYTAVVPENSPIGTQVAQVSASDPDLNNVVRYDFSSPSQIKNLYRIDTNTGKIYTNDILTGKGRKTPYMISVRALDNGTPEQFSDTELYITIGDVSRNDGVPEFISPQPGEVAEVPEEASVGTAVYKALARDPDDPNTANGKIIYSFPDDGTIVRKLFKVDPDNGLITTRVALDREERDQYTLILEAKDLGNPVQQTSRILTVVVKDIDDHPPRFDRQKNSVPLSLDVEEELPIGSVLGEVSAIDQDIGDNAIIDYAIIYGNDEGIFSIERDDSNNGVIKLQKRLDRERSGMHTLTIKCFEPSESNIRNLRKSYDKLKLDEIQVKIHVTDKDDNNPSFIETDLTKGVRVNAPIYTEIGRVEAVDADAEAADITYHLDNVTFYRPKDDYSYDLGPEGFLVDPITGVIQTNQSYGRYSDGYFDVVIKATNSPDPSKSAFALVKIFVLQDTDLMKFVFDENPVNVAKQMKQFKNEVEAAFAQPLTLNVYDNEFYSKVDGSLDFGRTSSCFQVLDKDKDVVDLEQINQLFDDRKNRKLGDIFDKYSVTKVERCSQVRAAPTINWIQILILIIAVFIGLVAFIASITICCLHSKYKRRIRRSNIKIVEAPVRALIPASLPPGSVMGPAPSLLGHAQNPSIHGSNGRIYEWQETAMPIDTASYRSLPR